MTRQTLGYRLGSMIGFTLSGCFAAWAIVDAERQTLMLGLTLLTFVLGLWLARKASKALYGKR
jgi:prepilin signal peptidase PulO-like enzyme (type II secretory pathway)